MRLCSLLTHCFILLAHTVPGKFRSELKAETLFTDRGELAQVNLIFQVLYTTAIITHSNISQFLSHQICVPTSLRQPTTGSQQQMAGAVGVWGHFVSQETSLMMEVCLLETATTQSQPLLSLNREMPPLQPHSVSHSLQGNTLV